MLQTFDKKDDCVESIWKDVEESSDALSLSITTRFA
jgi:hypothetical protein